MAENTVYVRGTRAEVRKAIAAAVAAAAGKNGDAQDAANALMVRLGMTALARIRHAFVVKSKGGTDDCGLKWPALAKSTVAYSRRHPGVLYPGSARAAFRPSWMLTDKQRSRWWQLYSVGLARSKGDKGQAARYAWAVLKAEGAETLIGKYGNTPVLILRDLGLLLNSLSPGVDSGSGTPPSVENQVFKIGSGEVIVGTNRKHAGAHHNGIPGRLPQRRLWPAPSDWTAAWWNDIAEQGRAGLIDITVHFLQRLA